MLNKLLAATAMAVIAYATCPANAAKVGAGCSGENLTKVETMIENMADGEGKIARRRKSARAGCDAQRQDAQASHSARPCTSAWRSKFVVEGRLPAIGPSDTSDARELARKIADRLGVDSLLFHCWITVKLAAGPHPAALPAIAGRKFAVEASTSGALRGRSQRPLPSKSTANLM